MRNEKYLKICAKFPPKEVLNELCWTPSMAAKAIGMTKNTILNWARKTKNGEMDMPIRSARAKRHQVFIPVREFLDWYGYEGQN